MIKRNVSCALVCTFIAAASLAGCERKERVLDVKTPSTDVHVDRNIDTGKVEIDTVKKK